MQCLVSMLSLNGIVLFLLLSSHVPNEDGHAYEQPATAEGLHRWGFWDTLDSKFVFTASKKNNS